MAAIREQTEALDQLIFAGWTHQPAEDLAREVVALCEQHTPRTPRFVYADADSLWDKAVKVAQQVYGAAQLTASPEAQARLAQLQADGWDHLAVCFAKTQYSFSTDPKLLGAPTGHTVHVREVRLSAGAGFVVLVCGDVMTMPGLPAHPAAETIDLDDAGQVTGLF